MDLNQIEKQLAGKSNEDIKKCAQEIVDILKKFAGDKAGRGNATGIHWPTNRTYNKDWTKYDGVPRPEYTYEYTHFNYKGLENYIFNALQTEYLDHLVKHKTQTLLSKLELLD